LNRISDKIEARHCVFPKRAFCPEPALREQFDIASDQSPMVFRWQAGANTAMNVAGKPSQQGKEKQRVFG
jgi:hypothetical protein